VHLEKMQIYIDESGSFAGFERSDLRSLAAVGALCIPNGRLAKLCQNYDRLRRRLPKENGEVKGRILSEEEIAAVVGMLAKNDVLLELSVTDVGAHRKNDVARYRDRERWPAQLRKSEPRRRSYFSRQY
jgi:hypothetical protein